MAIYVSIRKIGQKNSLHIYKISSMHQKKPFFIAINTLPQQIIYYKDKYLQDSITTIDLMRETGNLDFPGIDRLTGRCALRAAMKAIENNNFPDILDYAA